MKFNYYEELVWNIDKVLLALGLVLAVIVAVYVLIISYFENKRRRNLSAIKQNVHALALLGQKPTGGMCPAVDTKTAERFLDVEMEREQVLFNETEKEFIKKCFASPEKIASIKKIAKSSVNKWRRIEGILSLGYAADADALRIIGDGVLDKDEDIAYHSLLSLGLIKTVESAKMLLAILKANTVYARKIVSILETFPPFVADEAIKLAGDSDPLIRFWMVKLISRFKQERFVGKITDLMRDPSADVRAAACECLGLIAKKDTKHALVQCLKDTEWFVRMQAVRALAAVAGEEAVQEIAGLMDDDKLAVRDAVKLVMAAHIRSALPFVEKELLTGDELARKEAVETLDISGHTVRIVKGLISSDANSRAESTRLVKAMLAASAHFGIETAIGGFDASSQKKAVEAVKSIDPSFGLHLEKRLKHEIEES